MSFFGKFLAFLNLLGAAGLIYLASVDYAARQQWAYAALRYELTLTGLPVDQTHLDQQSQPLAEQLSDDAIANLFSGVGNEPRRTQAEEVEAVKTKVNALVAQHDADKRQQAFVLAGVLFPFADGVVERDQYLATQANLANDKAFKALEARYVTALREAKRAGASGKDRSFEQAFRLAVRSQAGPPSEALTTLIADKLPKDAAADVNMPALFAAAVETQRQGMVARLERLFADALTNPQQSASAAPGAPQNSRESQRAAIARLLVGMTLTQAAAAIDADPNHPDRAKVKDLSPGTVPYSRALAETDVFKRLQRRVMVVCGIKTGLEAIGARSSALRELAGQVDAAASDERTQFLSDQAFVLEQARVEAARLREEALSLAGNRTKLATQQRTVALRTQDVAKADAELKKSLDETDYAIKRLRDATAEARVNRVKARNLLGTLAEREKQIQELERQVREAQTKDRGAEGKRP